MTWSSLIKDVNSGNRYILAVSGGIDSMVLLDFFNRSVNGRFKVVHFNHNIREQNVDENLLRKYCYENDIELYVGYGINLKHSKNQECEARSQRWDFFEKIARTFDYDTIVTAHHKNDVIENFIMQIMRGNNITSCTMKENNVINGINRYKPFLQFTKNELEKSAKRYNISWVEDETNHDDKHLRNHVRHNILPLMGRDHNVIKSISNTIKSIEELSNNERI